MAAQDNFSLQTFPHRTLPVHIIFKMKFKKLASTKLTVESSQVTFLPTSKSLDTKTRPNIKNPA